MPYSPLLVKPMREELTSLGCRRTARPPRDVDRFMAEKHGTAMLVVNSVCGCAAGMARPGVRLALQQRAPPGPHRHRLRRPGRRGDRARPRLLPGHPAEQPVDRLLQGGRAGLLHAPPPDRRAERRAGGDRPGAGLRGAGGGRRRLMGTFHQDRCPLHGITVVVDTAGPDVYVGRCDDEDDERVILLDADSHREADGAPLEGGVRPQGRPPRRLEAPPAPRSPARPGDLDPAAGRLLARLARPLLRSLRSPAGEAVRARRIIVICDYLRDGAGAVSKAAPVLTQIE